MKNAQTVSEPKKTRRAIEQPGLIEMQSSDVLQIDEPKRLSDKNYAILLKKPKDQRTWQEWVSMLITRYPEHWDLNYCPKNPLKDSMGRYSKKPK